MYILLKKILKQVLKKVVKKVNLLKKGLIKLIILKNVNSIKKIFFFNSQEFFSSSSKQKKSLDRPTGPIVAASGK